MRLNLASSIHLSRHSLSLLCTPPSLPAKLPSVSTTLYFLFLQQWQQQCRQPDCIPHPPFCQPAYQRAGRPVSGPVPDGLGQQCVLGLHPLKRGAFHRRGLLFDAAAVCFWQDSCSKPSRPPRARLKEGTWLPISTSTWGHRRSLSPANHVWFCFKKYLFSSSFISTSLRAYKTKSTQRTRVL